MRLPRFTTRQLMVLVAVVAVLVWAGGLHQLAAAYRQRATELEMSEQLALSSVEINEGRLRRAEAGLSAFRAGRLPVDPAWEQQWPTLLQMSRDDPIAYK